MFNPYLMPHTRWVRSFKPHCSVSRYNILQRILRLRSDLPKCTLPCDSNVGFLNPPSFHYAALLP